MSSASESFDLNLDLEYSPDPNTFQCNLKGSKKCLKNDLFFTDIHQLGAPHTKKVSTQALRSNIEVKVIKRSKRSKKFDCQKFMSEH